MAQMMNVNLLIENIIENNFLGLSLLKACLHTLRVEN
jgi:hypothetical protein